MKNSGTIIAAVIAALVLIFLSPAISFLMCYIAGWICKVTIGNNLAGALNVLFNVDYFTADKLPLISAALGFIGSYFKRTTINKGDK